MPDQSADALAKKLRLTPETRLLALNAPDSYLSLLGQGVGAVAIATQARAGDHYDAAHVFVREKAQAQVTLPTAIDALRPGGVLWVMWPKQSSGVKTDLNRDALAALAMTFGWGPVSNVSIDETWSALRLRPEASVKRTSTAWPPQE